MFAARPVQGNRAHIDAEDWLGRNGTSASVAAMSTSLPASSVGRTALRIATGPGLLRPLKTSESVARDIVDDIVRLELREGDGLASEAAMLEQYDVSRESLREGLRLLEVQGLISIRRGPGGGPIVGSVDPANLGRTSTLYYHLAGATYAELFDAWESAEIAIAELAARNPARDVVRATMAKYRQSPAEPAASVEEFVTAHTEFHTTLALLTQNKVMQISLMAIGQIVTHHIVVDFDPREVAEMIENDHRDIADAVAAGHARKARHLMARHIRAVVGTYEREIGSRIHDLVEWR